MSGGSFDYFFAKDPEPENETKIILEMMESIQEHQKNLPKGNYSKIVIKLGKLYDDAENLRIAYENYKQSKEENSRLLKDIEWANSGDISFKDINP